MEKNKVVYRLFEPSDADGVIDVIRELYKDDYFNAMCYDREYILRSQRDKQRIIFVAELDGEIIGVTNGNYMDIFPGSFEIGLHALKKEFQGNGYAKKLLDFCVKSMRQMNLYGVYGMAVTFHSRSQKESEDVGLIGTGMWLGRHRADRTFFTDKPHNCKLHSLMVAASCKLQNDDLIYAPNAHREYIKSIYDELGVSCSFGGDAYCEKQESIVIKRETVDAKNKELFFTSIGHDAIEIVRKLFINANDDYSFTLFLNMLDSGIAAIYPELIDMGFYFTGIAPLHQKYEYLIMHKEPEKGYVWDEIALTARNSRIRDYILANKGR